MPTNPIRLLRFVTVGITANILLRQQLCFLDRHFELSLVCAPGEHVDQLKASTDLHIIPISFHRDISLWADTKTLYQTYRLLRREKPAIIHANTPKASLLAMIAGRAARVPIRIYTVTGVRYQTTVGIKRWILKSMERITCAFATAVNVEGPGVQRFYAAEQITNKSLEIIGDGSLCGVDIAKFDPNKVAITDLILEKETIDYDPALRYVLAVGRVVRDKGISELVQAFARARTHFPQLRLVLIGPYERQLDSLPPDVEKEISASPYIIHVPWTDHVERYLYLCDLLVHASYREGFPNVPLQAGAMGLPVLCSRIPGNTDIISEGRTGTCFEAADPDDLLEKLLGVLKNPALSLRYAEQLQVEIQSKYPQAVIHQNLLEYYKRLLDVH